MNSFFSLLIFSKLSSFPVLIPTPVLACKWFYFLTRPECLHQQQDKLVLFVFFSSYCVNNFSTYTSTEFVLSLVLSTVSPVCLSCTDMVSLWVYVFTLYVCCIYTAGFVTCVVYRLAQPPLCRMWCPGWGFLVTAIIYTDFHCYVLQNVSSIFWNALIWFIFSVCNRALYYYLLQYVI